MSEPHEPTWITVASAEPESVEVEWRAYGVATPPDHATLAFEVAGRLSARGVEIGDRVQADQALGHLDAAPYRHALAGAQAEARRLAAQRNQAERDLRRARELRGKGAFTVAAEESTATRAEALTAGVAGARAQVAEAERRLARATLGAPFAAVVVAIHAQPGEVLAAGQPVVTLHADGPTEVRVDLPSQAAAALQVGTMVEIQGPEGGPEPAVIIEVGASATGPGQLFPARARLLGSTGLRPGVAVALTARRPAGEALLVPLGAVADPAAAGPWVYRLAGDQVERVPVVLGALFGARIAVLAGLAPGDRVVTSHLMGLRPGQKVQVRP